MAQHPQTPRSRFAAFVLAFTAAAGPFAVVPSVTMKSGPVRAVASGEVRSGTGTMTADEWNTMVPE